MDLDVLVVDDDVDMRTTLEELLADEGYVVESLSGAKTLIDVIESRSPKLVLLDLTMPGFDVSATAQIMHERGISSRTRIIALSGLDRLHQLVEEYGFHGALPKPFEIDQLFELVAETVVPRSDTDSASPGDVLHP